MPWQPPEGDKERHLRWMEMAWERYQTNAHEERRKDEIVEYFEYLAELSKRRMEAPHLPTWESLW
jgi:hypothetical protein